MTRHWRAAAAPRGFDSTKGWRLVQTITNDDADVSGENQLKQQNYAKIGYCGLDVSGDSRVRVFYWQGWQSQQDFLYNGDHDESVTRQEVQHRPRG